MATLSAPPAVDTVHDDLVTFYTSFLEGDHGRGPYTGKVEQMIKEGASRLIVNVNDIRDVDPERAAELLENPNQCLHAFEDALKAIVNGIVQNPDETKSYHVGLEGSVGENYVTPRKLTSQFLGKLICLEGIVTRCSLIRPKVIKSVHYCDVTGAETSREYRDCTMIGTIIPTTSAYPQLDDHGNPYTTEYGRCVYLDFQTISMQEMPEKAPAGQIPRSLDVILNDDLVDKVKPGDRVHIMGCYRATGGKTNGNASGTFTTRLIANNIKVLAKEIQQTALTTEDIRECNKILRRKDFFELLSRSLAPSIYGHENIKKAILLQMVGGVEKNLETGTHLRGDINILMMGDPSTAKSQLLRFVLNVAPLAIATTGRGSSGVGLTAAVTSDKDTGERRLEAGAMVLADRGVVCIDEFDKMSILDRVAIHEVMEQQTVTIAKAGIHTSLNARCSVLAAANPKYGQYMKNLPPQQNINLPDSLLSRFDLLFIVLDDMNATTDTLIASHVIKMHMYKPPGQDEGAPIQELKDREYDNQEEPTESRTEIYYDYDDFITGSGKVRTSTVGKSLTIPFMKKFIRLAKMQRPVLTSAASAHICKVYQGLRNDQKEKNVKTTVPITPRTVENLIRLATAHAKLRLSKTVEEIDALEAEKIITFALFQKVEKRKKKIEEQMAQVDLEDEIEEDMMELPQKPTLRSQQRSQAQTQSQALTASSSQSKPRAARKDDEYDFPSEEEDDAPAIIPATRKSKQNNKKPAASSSAAVVAAEPENIVIEPARLELFRTALRNIHRSSGHEQECSMTTLQMQLGLMRIRPSFTKKEAVAMLAITDAEGTTMYVPEEETINFII